MEKRCNDTSNTLEEEYGENLKSIQSTGITLLTLEDKQSLDGSIINP